MSATSFAPTAHASNSAFEHPHALLQEGLIQNEHLAFFCGSIAVNDYGDAVVGFTGYGTNEFASSFAAAACTDSSGHTAFSTPVMLKAGVDDYAYCRWGDYSATVLDPNNPLKFWTVQEYISADDTGTALWELLRGSLFGVASYPSAMNTIQTHFRISLALAALLLTIGLAALAPLATAAEGEFSKPVIDIGMVVKDSERTAQFLTNVVGFKEVRGFSVNAEVGRKIGLVDGYPAEVRVFVLEGTEPATRIKVLSFPKAQGKQADQAFIHSTLGFRYLTLYVTDMNQILARLKRAGVPTLGETPMEMGSGTWLVAIKDPDGNFIEFVGPRK